MMDKGEDRLTSNMNGWILIACEVLAITSVFGLRLYGVMPLPAWPFLLIIAAIFGAAPWRSWSNPMPGSKLPIRMLIAAALVGIGYQFFTIFIEGPFLAWLFGEAETPPDVDWLVGNVAGLIGILLVMVVFSIGEELAFRGYLLERMQEWLGRSSISTFIALLLSSVAFGFMHTWQNLPGITGTVISGLVFGGIFLVCGKDIRAPIVTHLTVNITGAILAFFGLFIS